jgi:predicted TPR repeat methyltransferase
MNEDSKKALRKVMRARAITGSEEARSVYADWADTYDDDVFATLKITGSDKIADLLYRHVADVNSANVLDAGCGTGAVADSLKPLGFTLIDGVDLSPEMLEVARSKKLYRNLVEGNLNEKFSLPHSPYSAIISAGTFTTGHVGAEGFRNLFSHLQRGGLMACVIAMPVWERDQFAALTARLPVDVLVNRVEATIPDGEPDAHLLVLRKNRT